MALAVSAALLHMGAMAGLAHAADIRLKDFNEAFRYGSEYTCGTDTMKITKVKEGTPFYGHLRPGDIIDRVNGKPYAINLLNTEFVKLFRGEIPVVSLEILRNNKKIEHKVSKAR